MSTPPFLLGFALLFWGRHTDMLVPGIIMAVLLEGSRVAPWRMDLGARAFSLLWRLCSFLFLGVAAYVYITERSMEPFVRGWGMQWSPVIFFPIAAAQVYSTSPRLDSAIFFYYMRTRPIALAYPYLFLVLLATTATDRMTTEFYVGFVAVLAWTLWSARRKSAPAVSWIALVLVAGLLGYGGGLFLRSLQRDLIVMMVRFYKPDRVLERSATSIGELGELKLSGVVVFRVRPVTEKWPGHVRLSRASFNAYRDSVWSAVQAPLARIAAAPDRSTWRLIDNPPSAGSEELEMVLELDGGKGVVLTPSGTVAVTHLSASDVSASRMGAVMVEGGPKIAEYRVRQLAGQTIMGPPDRTDLLVPPKEAPAVSRIVGELGIGGAKGREVLTKLAGFFQSNFRYSLDLTSANTEATPLADFLLRTRAGHCEYFATAATLLLRQAGVPARYTVGYLSEEFSPLENAFLVRSRDAHAWVSAYVDGAWQIYDPTPSSWIAQDRNSRSFFEPFRDLWSALVLAVKLFNEGPSSARRFLPYAAVIVVPVLAVVLWRLRKRLKTPGRRAGPASTGFRAPGLDSPFYRIEAALSGQGRERRNGETHQEWLDRLRREQGLQTDGLSDVLTLHQRLRFDPTGISEAERKEMEELTGAWLRNVKENAEARSSNKRKDEAQP